MKSSRSGNSSRWTAWIILISVFLIAPTIFYIVFVHESVMRVYRYRTRVDRQADGFFIPNLNLSPATDEELAQLKLVKQKQLARIKKIETRESLLHFYNVLADALALQAEKHGLQVAYVDLRNSIIAGRYIPHNVQALDTLRSIPGTPWYEIHNPLELPMLKLPSLDLDITVSGPYSRVFSYIESLSAFPAQVLMSGLWIEEGSDGRCYRMNIRGFYYDAVPVDRLAQADTETVHEEALLE